MEVGVDLRLNPEAKYLIAYLQQDDTFTFEDIRDRLLEHAGLTPMLAGQKILDLHRKDMTPDSDGPAQGVPIGHTMNYFKCGRVGHPTSECKSSGGSTEPQQLEKLQPRCFTCGVVGHKSPDCPTKATIKKEPEDTKKKDSKKLLRNNKVSLSEDDPPINELTAMIADQEVLVLLYTGVQITILPEEVVPVEAKTGDKVRVKGYVGKSELRDVAKVKIRVGNRTWEETVALVKGSEISWKGLLAINLHKKRILGFARCGTIQRI